MERTINNPQEFLAWLQNNHSQSVFDAVPDAAMRQAVEHRAAELGETIGAPGTNFGRLIQILSSEIVEALTDSQRERVAAEVAIGVLDHPSVNAGIMKGFEGFTAVVINSGFMMALNKFLKILHAMHSPASVVYCNRGDPDSMSGEDYARFFVEFVEHYRAARKPLGPRLLLQDDAAARVARGLDSAERFALCHEFGHFLNGDLEDGTFVRFAAGVDKLVENVDHAREFAADRTGFEIFLGTAGATDREEVIPALLGVVGAFDFIYVVAGGEETGDHPAPLERGVRLARESLGKDAESALRSSYEDPTALLDLR